MLSKVFIFFFLFSFSLSFAQVNSEKFPTFPKCEGKDAAELETCFYNEVQTFVYSNFRIPANSQDLKTAVNILFEVDKDGNFKVQYVDAVNEELISEGKRVFAMLPKVKPPTYNGTPSYSKYAIRVAIPLQNPAEVPVVVVENSDSNSSKNKNAAGPSNPTIVQKENPEFDQIKYSKFNNPQFQSNLNIPLSHSY
jgi:hypothetical protein